MKKFNFSRLVVIAFVITIFSFIGCKPDSELPAGSTPITPVEISADDAIIGSWADNYSGWNTYGDYDCQIAINFIETASYGKHESKIYVVRTSSDSGYIYYQFSEDVTGYNGPNPYTVNAKGKWCAIAFKNLTATTVLMCDVYDPDYNFPASLEECYKKYTIANGYFNSLNTMDWTKL